MSMARSGCRPAVESLSLSIKGARSRRSCRSPAWRVRRHPCGWPVSLRPTSPSLLIPRDPAVLISCGRTVCYPEPVHKGGVSRRSCRSPAERVRRHPCGWPVSLRSAESAAVFGDFSPFSAREYPRRGAPLGRLRRTFAALRSAESDENSSRSRLASGRDSFMDGLYLFRVAACRQGCPVRSLGSRVGRHDIDE